MTLDDGDAVHAHEFGSSRTSPLPAGTVVAVAEVAGIMLKGQGDKLQCRCPFHGPDEHPSAFVSVSRNLFHCRACDESLSAKSFAEKLGVRWPVTGSAILATNTSGDQGRDATAPRFSAEDARGVWRVAYARARDDGAIDQDRPVYDYLARRNLCAAWEEGGFGVIHESMRDDLPEVVRDWPRDGYRIVAPLFAVETGALANVQARSILRDADPKTKFPFGSRARGRVFANGPGVGLLRGERGHDRVLLVEGMTDTFAATIATGVPVLGAPGTGAARGVVSEWCRGRTLVLAFDADRSGDAATRDVAIAIRDVGGTPVQLVLPAGCKDLCDVLEREGEAALFDLVAETVETLP